MSEEPKEPVKKEEAAGAPETVVTSTVTQEEDLEAKNARLEEEKANYKLAFLKEKSKNRQENFDDETDEEKIERIVSEKLAASKMAQIDAEKDALLKQALKENKELKLAHLNKTNIPPAGIGSHNESTPVKDTLITPDQAAAFKARGWSDKDIERYKKNLQRYSGR